MNKLKIFNVAPNIPENIKFLEKLSKNLWWTWNSNAQNLFRRIDPSLWYQSERNAVVMLLSVSQERLEELSRDEGFVQHLNEVKKVFEDEVENKKESYSQGECMAYFSLEYGLHESIRIYSGGLGILAGDHLKTASDMDMCLIGVGLYYREGYFRQHLNNDGWQEESYPANKVQHLPLHKVVDPRGDDLVIELKLPDGVVKIRVWRVDVGRTRLLLLDTNLPDNKPEHRDITSRLYGGDRKMRLEQEIVLGIGGFFTLIRMGYEPKVCHINEGHAAFLNIARLDHFVRNKGLSLEEALQIVPRTKVFTTHTPVPAGHESFRLDLLKPHLEAVMEEFEIDVDDLLSLAQVNLDDNKKDHEKEMSMTILGLRTSAFSNGVSELHGQVSRKMWSHLWPNHAIEEIPIHHITNGVHLRTWISEEIALLLERYIGSGWDRGFFNGGEIKAIDSILPEELWHAHEIAGSRMIATIRKRLQDSLKAKQAPGYEIGKAESVLDNNVLTIGFARRFATYKRANLILHDIERLKRLLLDQERPIQLIFSGKAHPADEEGKKLIQQVYHLSKDETLGKRIVFLEDYDMFIAERMVQGVDIWLNNPRRPREASGTSGMKAALNGAINFSVLDGWWAEAYNGKNGWPIGKGEVYEDHKYQDHVEAQYLYNTLENEIIPLYYQKKNGNIPVEWVNKMKESIKTILHHFSSHRMVKEYMDYTYKPALQNYDSFFSNDFQKGKENTRHYVSLRQNWDKVKIYPPESDRDIEALRVGDQFKVTARVYLDDIDPELVDLEVYYGPLGPMDTIEDSHTVKMSREADEGKAYYRYSSEINCETAGRYGFTVRAVPRDEVWKHTMPGQIIWADI
jgi:starch phosphorylase